MSRPILASLATALAALCAAAPVTAQQPPECNRACLTGFLDAYLEALSRHDASSLPMTPNVRYTENGQRINFTDGLWRTVKGLPHYRLNVVDEAQGTIAMLGLIDENSNRNFFSVRLKVEKGHISEIENLIARSLTGGAGLGRREPMRQPHPLFLEPEPKGTRLTRAQLVDIVDSYFTGLDTEESSAHIPFDPDCQRIENGVITANSPDPQARPMARLGCKAQFDTGFSAIVTDVRERRYPAVDLERGLVYALVFFDHNGAVTHYTQPDGTIVQVADSLLQPFSLMIAEVFKVKDGKLRQIEAVLTPVPYGMGSGW